MLTRWASVLAVWCPTAFRSYPAAMPAAGLDAGRRSWPHRVPGGLSTSAEDGQEAPPLLAAGLPNHNPCIVGLGFLMGRFQFCDLRIWGNGSKTAEERRKGRVRVQPSCYSVWEREALSERDGLLEAICPGLMGQLGCVCNLRNKELIRPRHHVRLA